MVMRVRIPACDRHTVQDAIDWEERFGSVWDSWGYDQGTQGNGRDKKTEDGRQAKDKVVRAIQVKPVRA